MTPTTVTSSSMTTPYTTPQRETITPPHDDDEDSDYEHKIWIEHAVDGVLPGVVDDVKALVCHVTSDRARIVTWQVNGTDVSTDETDLEFAEDTDDKGDEYVQTTSSYILRDTSEALNGDYSCRVQKLDIADKASVIFIEKEKSMEKLIGREGNEVEITCNLPRDAEKVFMHNQERTELFEAGKELQTDSNGIVWLDYTLTISEPEITEKPEVFVCIARFGGDKSIAVHQTIALTITPSVELKLYSERRVYGAGEKVTLNCAASEEISSVVWYRGDTVLTADTNHIMEMTEVSNLNIAVLTLPNATESQTGGYMCAAEDYRSDTLDITIIERKMAVREAIVNEMVLFSLECWSYKKNFNLYREGTEFTAFAILKDETSIESVVSEPEKDIEGDDWEKLTIAMRLSAKQGGLFECVSEFQKFQVSNYTYDITVEELGSPVVTPIEGYPMAPKGSDISLTCTIEADIDLLWQFNGKDLKEKDYTNDFKNGVQTSILSLTDVDAKSTGFYGCQTVSRNEPTIVTVNVYDPADFKFKESNYIQKDSALEFQCYAVEGENITVTMGDAQLNEGQYSAEIKENFILNGFAVNRYDVSIKIISLKQAGAYGCTSDAFGQKEIFTLIGELDIYTQPEIQAEGLSNGNYYTSVGETFTVTNMFHSTIDVSKATEMRYVHEKDPTDDVIDIEGDVAYNKDTNTVSTTFVINDVQLANSGTYRLHVKVGNSLKLESEPIKVSVIGKREVSYELAKGVGEEFNITCYTLNSESATMEFFFKGTQLEEKSLTLTEGQVEEDKNGAEYSTVTWTISNITVQSAGIYKCIGKNDNGQTVADVSVDFSVYTFSDTDSLIAALIGDEVIITCLLVNEPGAFMVYKINNTETDDVVPKVGAKFISGEYSYTTLFWELGPMSFPLIGHYTCESWVGEEKIVSMETDLIGFNLVPPPIVMATGESVTATCVYDGPPLSAMHWYVDGKLVEDADRMNHTARGPVRKDTLAFHDMNAKSDINAVKCEYHTIADFNLTVSREFLVTYAVMSDMPRNMTYVTDDVTLTCKWNGNKENAQINWYHVTDKGMKPLTNTDPNKGSYHMEHITNGTENALLLHLSDIGYLGVEAMCSVDFKKDEMVYKHENMVSLIRRGFSAELPSVVVHGVDQDALHLTCMWGSSDRPTSVTWLKDGKVQSFPFPVTVEKGYEWKSKMEILSVTTKTDETWTCLFEDEAGNKEQSVAQIYGAEMSLDNKGDVFYPTHESAKVICTFDSVANLSQITWQKDGEEVDDGEEQHVYQHGNTISLTSLDIDLDLDGKYTCEATAFGVSFSKSVYFAHTSVQIAGEPAVDVKSPDTVTLTCAALSRAEVEKISWLVNGDPVANYNKETETDWKDFKKESVLEVNAVRDAFFKSTTQLNYVCVVYTKHGKETSRFTDFVELTLRTPVIMEPISIALETEWTLTCKVISHDNPLHVQWVHNNKTIHTYSPQNQKSGEVAPVDPDAPQPGDDDYVVHPGTFSYEKNYDTYTMQVTDSSYVDGGDYTCKLVYEDGSISAATTPISVRGVMSSLPHIYYTPLATTTLSCVLYSDEKPTSAQWYYSKNGKSVAKVAGGQLTSDSDIHKFNLAVTDPGEEDVGIYQCEFAFEDDENPQYEIVLQFAELKLISPTSLTIQTGQSMTLTASIFSTNWQKYVINWYRDGTAVQLSDGFKTGFKKSNDGSYNVFLTKKDMTPSEAGGYNMVFTAEGYAVTLTSDAVNVAVIGSASETTYITSSGGPQVLNCTYQGAVKPGSLKWLYNDAALDTDKWKVDEGVFKDAEQTSVISASDTGAGDTGKYVCIFTVNDIAVSSLTELTVRTAAQSASGETLITDSVWTAQFTLGSVEKPKGFYVIREEERIKIGGSVNVQTGEFADNQIVYTLKITFDDVFVGGGIDGTYTCEVAFEDGTTLQFTSITITARIIISKDISSEAEKILLMAEERQAIYRDCSYYGKSTPNSVVWMIGDEEIKTGENTKISQASDSIDGLYETAVVVKTTMATVAAWNYVGDVKCRFVFGNGDNVEMNLQKVYVVEHVGDSGCTSLASSIDLSCGFKSKANMTGVQWTKDGAVVTEGVVTSDYTESTVTSTLKKDSVTDDDSGDYKCQPVIEGGFDGVAIKLEKLEPLIVKTVDDAPYYFGQRVTVVCMADDKNAYGDIVIRKDGEDQKTKAKKAFSYLDFQMRTSNGGNFTCLGTTVTCGEKKRVSAVTSDGAEMISIIGTSPSPITQPQSVVITSGDSIMMSCVFPYYGGGAPAWINWQREGSDNLVDKITKTDEEAGTTTAVFYKKKSDEDDAKSWKCVAKYTDQLVSSDWADVVVMGYTTNPESITGIAGSTATMTCKFTSSEETTLIIETTSGDISNAAVTMTHTDTNGVIASEAKVVWSNLVEGNEGVYWCRVGSDGAKSKKASVIQVLGITEPVEDAAVIVGGTAIMALHTDTFKRQEYTFTWQYKGEDGGWVNATEGDNLDMGEITGGDWKTFVNLKNIQADDPQTWRVVVSFQQEIYQEEVIQFGGELISGEGTIKIYGATTSSLAPDADPSFEGTTFTLVCSVSTPVDIGYIAVKIQGYRFDTSTWKDYTTYEFADEVAKTTVEAPYSTLLSGQQVTCEARYQKSTVIRWSETFPTVYRKCSEIDIGLEADHGNLTYTDVADESGKVTGQSVTLQCNTTGNYYPQDENRMTSSCDYTTGKWSTVTSSNSKPITTCNYRRPIDPRKLIVGIWFSSTFCKDAATQTYVVNLLNTVGSTCGWLGTAMNIRCYHDDPQMCSYDNSASCELAMNSKGTKEGSLMAGTFEYTGDITTDEYKTYKSDVESGGSRYWSDGIQGDFWTCKDPAKRKKRALTLDEMRIMEEIYSLEPEIYIETVSANGEVERRTVFSSETSTPTYSSYTSGSQEVTDQDWEPEEEHTEQDWATEEEQTASPSSSPAAESRDTSSPEFIKNWFEQPVQVDISQMIMGTVLVVCFCTSLVLFFIGARRYLRRTEEKEKMADYPKKPSAYNLFE